MKEKHIKYIALYCLVILSISCNYNNKSNLKELQIILGNFSTSSFFITVDVKCEEETFPIVITNNSFYNILLKRRIVKNQDDYTNKIIKKIINEESLLFDVKDLELLKGYSVIENDTLNILLKKNKEDFMNKYFANNILKTKELSFVQEKSIIYSLFKNRTYCRRDCVSGSILIVQLNTSSTDAEVKK